MGYYIDLIFDPREAPDSKTVISSFCHAAASQPEEQKILYPEELTEQDWWWLEKDHETIWIIPHPGKARSQTCRTIQVELFEKESGSRPGCWAHVRLSWGAGPDDFRETLTIFIEFSKKAHCWIYDGQVAQFITLRNMETVVEGFTRIKSGVIKMLGTT